VCELRCVEMHDRYTHLKSEGLKEERVLLLESWRDVEVSAGQYGDLTQIDERMPKKIKMKRLVPGDSGIDEWEEYYDYNFPDDEKQIGNGDRLVSRFGILKLKMWLVFGRVLYLDHEYMWRTLR